MQQLGQDHAFGSICGLILADTGNTSPYARSG